jgi:hypothetical protein
MIYHNGLPYVIALLGLIKTLLFKMARRMIENLQIKEPLGPNLEASSFTFSLEVCDEQHTSTLNLAGERKKKLIKKVNDTTLTHNTEILPWKPKPGKPSLLEHFAPCCLIHSE